MPEHPRDPNNPKRYLCTAEQPMPKGSEGLWSHPDAKCVGGCAEGCCDDYSCPNCGARWRYENPQ